MPCLPIGNLNNISFVGCKQLLQNVDTDFYTGKKVKRQHRTVEHILPKSKGGKNNISNYAMTDSYVNSKRGNLTMRSWLGLNPTYLKNMKDYVKKYWDTMILNVKHGQAVSSAVKNAYGIDLEG